MDSPAFNIAPYSLPATPSNEIWLEEPRDITLVEVSFDGEPSADIVVSYQQKSWPDTRVDDASRNHPGHFGWIGQDDWFNLTWRTAAVSIKKMADGRAVITFKGLTSEPGFEGMTDYDVAFRRTYAIRVEASGNPRLTRVETNSAPVETTLHIELDAGAATPGDTLRVSGYNADITAIKTASGEAAVEDTILFTTASPRSLVLQARHMAPAHDYSGDDGHVMFEIGGEAFTISLTSLEEQGPVWFADMGVFITKDDDPTTFEAYQAMCAGQKTISHQVLERGEQSFAGAYNGQPRPHADNYSIGCTHASQRFAIECNGDVVMVKSNATWLPGKGRERYKCKETGRLFFGLETWNILARYPDPAPVLAYTLLARKGGLTVEQRSCAVPLLTPIRDGEWKGDDPMVALVRFRFRNEGSEPVMAELPISFSQESAGNGRAGNQDAHRIPRGPLDPLSLDGNRILSPWEAENIVRCELDTKMTFEARGSQVVLTRELKPGETCDAVLKIPYVSPEGEQELKALKKLSFEPSLADVTEYWRRVATPGARLQVPEPQLTALHAAHPAYILMSDYKMPDGLVNTSVGTSTYGNYSNESCMIVQELDQRGLHDQAQKRLDLWVKYQGTVEQPGNFTDYEGMYYGAGGYECGYYNQHHGWVLWCLSEHYLMTRDDAWFAKTADSIIAGADWVFRQRKNTLEPLPHSRGWEKGFLPAGSLEDVTDFYYWLSTNSLTWRGTEYAARALEAAGHPEAARVRQEANAYRDDLIRGFETMRQHTPLVRLRDGRWIPNYPSRLYRRGREVGWIREVLEGSVYLLISGLYDSSSKQGQWILDDYQDNRYMNPPYGYFVPDFDMTWFDRGGISMQPNLLAGLLPHLERDEPEIFIWMFYNAWNSCYREESNAMVEHPLPVLGWSNHALVKTSDEANAIMWLRYMLVYPHDGVLHIGKAIPRAWFAQPEPFFLYDVVTEYGDVSVRYEPSPGADKAKAIVTLNQTRAPRQILARFRHPDKKPIQTVVVNGEQRQPYDAARGDVDVTGLTGAITVEVGY